MEIVFSFGHMSLMQILYGESGIFGTAYVCQFGPWYLEPNELIDNKRKWMYLSNILNWNVISN